MTSSFYDPYGSNAVANSQQDADALLAEAKVAIVFPPNQDNENSFISHIMRLGLVEFRDRTTFTYNQGPADIKASQGKINSLASIYLPFPDQIQFAYAPTWDFVDIELYRPAMSAGRSLVAQGQKMANSGSLDEAYNKGLDFLKGAYSNMQNNIGDAAIYGVLRAASIAGAGDIAAAGQLIAQKAYNPYKEALFRGIANRAFNFGWTLFPKNAGECLQLQSMLKTLKKHSVPALTANTLLFDFPGEFTLEFFKKDGPTGQFTPNDNIPKIGFCVCTGIETNLTSNGVWAALENGHPVDIQLVMQFTEVEIVTKDKIEQGY